MSYVVGIDVGTTFSSAAVHRGGATHVVTLGNRSGSVPSVVFMRPDGSLLFGEEAFLRGVGEPSRLLVNLKRRLGEPGPVVVEGRAAATPELMGALLRWIVERVEAREGGPADLIAVSHPANWGPHRLEAFAAALDHAGLADAVQLTEPHAAALFHAGANPVAPGELVGVYDLGGGTFDAAVVRRTADGFDLVGQPEGVEHLGGVDFDEAMLHLVRSRTAEAWEAAERTGGAGSAGALAALRRECVAAKETLSSEERVTVPLLLPGVDAVDVDRAAFEVMIRPAVEESLGAFRRALRSAGVTPADLRAVLLVGGSSRIPLVRRLVAAAIGDTPLLDTDPRYAVARGVAAYATTAAARGAVAAPAGSAAPAAEGAAGATADRAGASRPGGDDAADAAPEPSTERRPAPDPAAAPTPAPAKAPTPAPAVAPAPAPLAAEPRRGRRRRVVPVAVGVVVVAAVVGAVLAATRSGSKRSPGEVAAAAPGVVPAAPGSTAPAGTGPTTTVAPRAPSPQGMVNVPAGSYQVGSATPGPEAAAARSVTVAAFFIDEYEVRNGDYARFVEREGAPVPAAWPDGRMPADQVDFPVVGVPWDLAQAYCAALSKRLPSEAEWEVAARGPDGRLYPWGDQPGAVDLDTPGPRPVGAVAGNVSAFGVHDTVGSVWEWVDEPYDPVQPSQKVRRGGEYGRVRDGAAMRQAVAVSNEAAMVETGFRCASTTTDPATPFLDFVDHHDALPTTSTTTAPAGTRAGGGDVLVDDNFENKATGWPERNDPGSRIGYHAPNWYHVEASQPNEQVLALGGFNFTDVVAETTVYIDKTDTQSGQYRYGLVFRADASTKKAPPPGIAGLERPRDFYAFVVNPRAGKWELLHDDTLPMRTQRSGSLAAVGLRVTQQAQPDSLRVEMRGSNIVMSINGTQVGTFDTRGYHLSGDIGFYVETMDETRAHAHFDQLTVTALH